MGAVASWRAASALIAEVQAEFCLPCNGQPSPGPCTCGRACACGHPPRAHEHVRDGSDCGSCPEGECSRYRRPRKFKFLRRRS